MKILLAGATGFIGHHLINCLLSENHKLFLLTRSPQKASDRYGTDVVCIKWDAVNSGPWTDYVGHSDALINLTGESLAARRWNEIQKAKLWSSRIDSTRILVEAIKSAEKKPRVLINASAVGYYGNVPAGDVDESFPPAEDFLGKLSQAWEAEALKASAFGVRVVRPRIGLVLGRDGGALEKMVLPFKLFIGGPLGSGRQMFPWIHIDDITGAFSFLLTQEIEGAFNLTAPHPVDMKTFCSTLGQVLKRPSWAPVPSFVLRVMIGEFAQSILGGQRAVPVKLLQAGYVFKHPDLQPALEDLLRK